MFCRLILYSVSTAYMCTTVPDGSRLSHVRILCVCLSGSISGGDMDEQLFQANAAVVTFIILPRT